jgi:hypothetical protein
LLRLQDAEERNYNRLKKAKLKMFASESHKRLIRIRDEIQRRKDEGIDNSNWVTAD